jgi:hypothetical protein
LVSTHGTIQCRTTIGRSKQQGDKDTLVPVAGTRVWVGKQQELGIKHKYLEIPGGNHIQSITQNPAMIAEVFAFLNKQKRK